MKKSRKTFRQIVARLSPTFRERGVLLRKFSQGVGLVHFGTVHQHDDEYSAIHGFTASLTHHDSHYAVGTYDGFNIRMVNRFDVLPVAGRIRQQFWTIIEIELEKHALPHMFFIPTGTEGGEYGQVYAARPNMQPLNTMLLDNKSPEFHGRFQIVARPVNAAVIETKFSSPLITTIASRFWPHGIEIERGKVLIYVTEHRPTKAVLESALASGLWLAETIDKINED